MSFLMSNFSQARHIYIQFYDFLFLHTEFIQLSTKLEKFNERNKKQVRIFALTNLGVYNLLEESFFKKSFSSRMKRFIPFEKIRAVSVSRMGYEFTIHVPEEYDYRFKSDDFREQILIQMADLCYKRNKQRLGFFYVDDFSLESSTTTKLDIKKTPKVSRYPSGEPSVNILI